MKTITLREAYALCATAPLLNNDKHKVQPNLGLLVKALADDPNTAALLVHCYNVLPELVDAASSRLPSPGTSLWIAFNKANKVQLP